VIARTGATTGASYTIKSSDPKNVVFASYLIRYRINKSIADPFFIDFCLRSSLWQSYVDGIAGGSAQPGANAKQLANFEINLPPLPEQKAIAEVLTSLDDKIDLLHKQNKTLEQLAETLFRHHFIDNAQDDWEDGKLGELLEVLESGSRPKGGIDPDLKDGVPSIGAESINGIGNFKFGSTKFVTHEFFAKMNRGKIENRDVLIYKDGAYIGRKAMFGNDFPFKECAVNEHVFILRTNKRITQTFLYFFLEEEELRSLNTNSAQPGLNQATLKSFDVTVPPQEKVYEFDKIVSPSMDKIFENSKQILILEKLRDQLLPKLMSGEIRIN